MSVIYINPYSFSAPWTPASITTALWLDASDSSTITRDSPGTDDDVSQWNDKSTNSRNATQSTDASKPLFVSNARNGLPVIRFNGSTEFFAMSTGLDWMAGTSHSAFFALKTSVYNNLYGAVTGNSTSQSLHVGFKADGPRYRTNLWNNDYELIINFTDFLSADFNIVNFEWNAGVNKRVYTNAKLQGTSTVPTPATISSMLDGGCIVNVVGQGYWGGDIGEIVMLNNIPSQATRELIEGYLAHKWALTGSLPAGHPYKTATP